MGFLTSFLESSASNMGMELQAKPRFFGEADEAAIQKSASWPVLQSLIPRLDKLPFDSDLHAQAMVYSTLVWVYVCAWEISSSYGTLDPVLYRGVGSDKKLVERKHPAWDLLEHPNQMESGLEFTEDTALMMELTGNGYNEIVVGVQGLPIKLFNLESYFMYIVPDPIEKVKHYTYDMGGPAKVDFSRDRVAHYKYANPLNQFYGQGTVQALQTTIITELYRETYNKSFLENEARPDIILKQVPDAENHVYPINMGVGSDRTPLLRLAKEWRASFAGPRKARLPVMLPPGIDVSVLSEARQDMDFREMEKSLRERILSGFGVPPCMAGLYEYANYANSREQIRIFWTVTMPPKVRRMAAVRNRSIIQPFWPDIHVEYPLANIPALEEDSKEHTERINSMFDRGGLNREDYREALGLPADPGDPHAKKYFINSSYVLLDDVVNPPEPEPPAPGPEDGEQGPGPSSENFSEGNNGGQLNG